MFAKNQDLRLERLVYEACRLVTEPKRLLIRLTLFLVLCEAFFIAMHFLVVKLQTELDIVTADGHIGGFDLNDEATLSVWFSSLQLLMIGVCCLALSWIDKDHFLHIKNKHFWLFGALVFTYLSADETGGLHEILGKGLVWAFPAVGLSASMWWTIPYMFLVGSLLGFMFFRFLGQPGSLALLSFGSLCWVLANALEHVDIIARYGDLALEEGLEMLGGSLLLVGNLNFLFTHAEKSQGVEQALG